MPANENSSQKSSNVYESNIPILKKNRIDSSKKSKVKKFPDLQKYIETILKANTNLEESDSPICENVAKSSDLEKTIEYKKHGGSKNINKLKNTNDKELGSCQKVKVKPKTKVQETLNIFSYKNVFQPKELDVEKNINENKENKMDSSPTLEIEKFLKKLYPNPYHLDEVNEFQSLKLTRAWRGKVEKNSTNLKSGQLLNTMFFKISDHLEGKAVIEELENHTQQNHVTELNQNVFQDRSTSNCENSFDVYSPNFTIEKTGNEEENCSISKHVKNPTSEFDEPTSVIDLTNRPGSNESGLATATDCKNNIIQKAKKNSKSTIENQQQTVPNSIDPRIKKKSRNKLIRFNEKPNKYDLSQLKMFYVKDGPSEMNFDMREINLQFELSDQENSGGGEAMVELNSIQMDRSMSVSKALDKDRRKKRKNSREVKKLYELMDKTTESLLVITTRNEKEILAKEEIKKANSKRSSTHHQLENNKFIQFIRNMNKAKAEKLNAKNDEKVSHCRSENCITKKKDLIENATNSHVKFKKSYKISSNFQNKEEKKTKVKSDCFKSEKRSLKKILPHSSSKEINSSFTTVLFKEASKSPLGQSIKNYCSNDIGISNSSSSINNSSNKGSISLYDLDSNFESQLLKESAEFLKLNPKINRVLECIQEYLEKFNSNQKNQARREVTQSEVLTEEGEPVTGLKKLKNEESKSTEKINVCEKNFKLSNIRAEQKNNGSQEKVKRLISDWSFTEINDHTIEMKKFGTRFLESRMRHCVRSQSNVLKSRIIPLNERDQLVIPWYSTPNSTRANCSLPAPEQQTVPSDNFNVDAEDNVQIVEENNELGGYTEGKPAVALAKSKSLCIPKTLLPLSVRIRKNKKSSSKALKKALETEENLLVNRFISITVPSQSNKFLVESFSKKLDFFLLDDEKSNGRMKSTEATLFYSTDKFGKFDSYGLLKAFKCQNSNLVICVNSLPLNMRTSTSPNLIFSSSLPLKSITSQEFQGVKEVSQISKYLLRRIFFSPNIAHTAFDLKKERLVFNVPRRVMIFCTAASICLHANVGFSKLEENIFLNLSENWINYRIVSLEKSAMAETFTFQNESVTILDPAGMLFDNLKEQTQEYPSLTSNTLSDVMHEDVQKQDLPPALDLESELQKEKKEIDYSDESNVHLDSHPSEVPLPWSNKTEKPSVSSKGADQKLNVEFEDDDKNKIHNLLSRTYNLQQKLRQYLRKMSSSSSSSNTFLKRSSLSDLCLLYENKTNFGSFPFNSRLKSVNSIQIDSKSMQTEETHPLVYWYAKSNSKFNSSNCFSNPETHLASEIQKVDHSTSYDSDIRKICGSAIEKRNLSVQKKSLTFDSEYDDLFSSSSFKSDFSECEKASEIEKSDGYKLSDLKNIKLFKKILNDLEMCRQSHNISKLDLLRKDSKNCGNKMIKRRTDNYKNSNTTTIVEHVTESPAKVLTTVFKGKNSVTELEIGLRDVPLSKVSVEKKKFSPNHTKISVCITNETPEGLAKPGFSETELRTCAYSKSLNAPQINFKRLNDSCEDLSEDEEDDFRSVASSFSCNSDTETTDDFQKTEGRTVRKESESVASKSYKKHLFNFNRIRDFNVEKDKAISRFHAKDNLCRELKPLRQALTDMQIRMRSLKENSSLNSNDYYDRALKLAKMSAGYCQSCGSRAVIPEDTFGYYKSVLPRRYSSHHLKCYLRNNASANSEFYSFRSSTELNNHLCDFDLNHSSSYLLNSKIDDPVLKRSYNNLSFGLERL